jgi:hypothetical protein
MKIDLNIGKILQKCYVLSRVLYGVETWTHWEVVQE